MSNVLAQAAIMLNKREAASIVAATGLIFEQLKKDSPDKQLEQVLISQKGGTWGEETVSGVGFPVLRSSNMRGKKVDVSEAAWCFIPASQAEAFALESGDILVTKSSGSSDLVGKSAIFFDPKDGHTYLFSNFTLRLRPDKTEVNPEYLAWFLRSPQSLMWRYEKQQNAVGLRNLQTKEYLNQIIPVPDLKTQEQVVTYLNLLEMKDTQADSTPLPPLLMEQRRIVVRIEALAARVAAAQSLRREASEQTITMIKAARNFAIGEKPNNNWLPLRTYVSEIFNGKSPDCEKRPANPNEWGVLKVGAVSFGIFDENENKALPPHIQPISEYEVKSGDFLMIRANTKELCGACAIVGKTRPKLLLSDKTFRFIFREDNPIDKDFLNHVLKSPALRIQIEQQASGTSPTMKNISKEKVMELRIPFFSLEEQRRIVTYLDGLQARVSELRTAQAETQKELDALLPSILDKAFKGEL